MRSVLAGLRRFVVPWTAGKTEPAIILDGDPATDPVIQTLPNRPSAVELFQIGNGKYFVFSGEYDAGTQDAYLFRYAWDYPARTKDVEIERVAVNTDGSGTYGLIDNQVQISWGLPGPGYSVLWLPQTEFRATVTFTGTVTLQTGVDIPTESSYFGKSMPRGLQACYWSTAGTLCGSTTAEAAVPSWNAASSGATTFEAGRIKRLRLRFGGYDSVSESADFTVRVRKGVNTTTGLQLAFVRPNVASVGANLPSFEYEAYVVNNTAGDITTTLGMTIQRVVGTGTVSLYGDANIRCMIDVEDVGAAADMPWLAGSATAIT